MKKLTKIVLGVVLSAAVCVTGGLAAITMNNAYAKNALTFDGYGTISATSANASVDFGSYKQTMSGVSFTGVQLTGGTGATFDLGTIDLVKSSWNGTYTSTGETVGDSFLEMVFNPGNKLTDSATKQDLGSSYEIESLEFTFKQSDSNYFKVKVKYEGCEDTLPYGREINVTTIAAGQNKDGDKFTQNRFGVYRSGKTEFQTQLRKGIINSTVAKKLYGTETALEIGTRGNSSAPLQLFYKNGAIYTTSTYVGNSNETGNGLGNSYLLRDFMSEDVVANDNQALTTLFTTDSDGKMNVNVSVTFGTVYSKVKQTSIVISKIGDYEFKQSKQAELLQSDESQVKNISATKGATVNFGTYAQSVSGKEYTGVNLSGPVGSSFNLGTISVNDTYFDSDWNYVKGTGVSYTKYNGAFYTGGDAAFNGTGAASKSFLTFVVNPSGFNQDLTKNTDFFKFSVTLTEKGNPSNFVTYDIQNSREKNSSNQVEITCKATNNTASVAERFRSQGITTSEIVRRSVDVIGSQPYAIGLYYNYAQQAAYTDVAFDGAVDGIKAAFRIRDFDAVPQSGHSDIYPEKVTVNGTEKKAQSSGVQYWEGFSENAELEVSLTINSWDVTTATPSIILTSLAGQDFSEKSIAADETTNLVKGSTVALNSLIHVKTGAVKYAYSGDAVKTIKVNNVAVTEANYTFTENATVSFYDDDDVLIATTNVVVSEVNVAPVLTNGDKFEIWRDGSDITNQANGKAQIGDIVRLYPGKQTVKGKTENYETGLYLTDIKTANFNGVTYNYNTETKQNAIPFTYVSGENGGYYTYTIGQDVLEFTPSVTFDKYCKITVKDEYVDDVVKYAWSTDKEVKDLFKTTVNNDAVNTGNSNGEKILMAYLRTDVNKGVTRDDGFTYDYGTYGSLYYSKMAIGSNENADKDKNLGYAIVPDMAFEAIYVDFKIEKEIKLVANVDSVNENLSGVRYVVKVEKTGFDKYVEYSKRNRNGKLDAAFRNYITTESQLKGVNKTVNDVKGLVWMNNDGWNGEVGKTNNLGLTLYNPGDKMTSSGYLNYTINDHKNGGIWLDQDKYNSENGKYYAYAITLNNLQNSAQTYVISTIFENDVVWGTANGYISNVTTINIKDLCEEKLTNNVSTTKVDDSYKYTFYKGGVQYYSKLALNHANWLANKGGLDYTYTAEAN